MSWHTSDRRTRLPRNWPVIRAATIARAGGHCQATTHDPRCDGTATDVDHITPGDNHHPSNLQALSAACHRAKTARESAQRAKRRAALRRRPEEQHPGAKRPDKRGGGDSPSLGLPKTAG